MRRLLPIVALASLLLSVPAIAQYPSKPVKLVVQFAAGGAADTLARMVAQPLGQALGQPVVVENRPGADGAIAATFVMQSPPDGYTLFFAGNSALSGVPAMRKVPPYDPVTNFTPIGMVGTFSYFLFVHPSVPAKNVGELIAYIRANPGKVNYAGATTLGIMAASQLASDFKLDMVRVPYKGEAPATIDLVSGQVQMMFGTPTNAGGAAKEGRLKVLAAVMQRRSSMLPQTPTMIEAGASKNAMLAWAAVFGPAKLPPEVVMRVNRELNAIIKRPDMIEQMSRQAVEPQGSTPEELGEFTKTQLELWRTAVRESGTPLE